MTGSPQRLFCDTCRHRRPPSAPRPPSGGIFNPKANEVLADYNKKLAEIALTEQRVLESGQEFTYKPKTLHWCEIHAQYVEREVLSPSTGRVGRTYLPTLRANSDGYCPGHSKRPQKPERSDHADGHSMISPQTPSQARVRVSVWPLHKAAFPGRDAIVIGTECHLVRDFGPRKEASDVIIDVKGPFVPADTARPPAVVLRDGFEQRLAANRLDPGDQAIAIEGEGLDLGYSIMGNPGSGKTNLLMHMLRQFVELHADDPQRKHGGLLLDPKAALIGDIRSVFETAGRGDDLIVLNENDLLRTGRVVNVLDCALPEHALGTALSLAAQSAGISGKEPYWLNEIDKLAGATLALMRFDRPGRKTIETLADLATCLLGRATEANGKRRANLELLIDVVKLGMRRSDREVRGDLMVYIETLEKFVGDTDPRNRATLESFINQAFGTFRLSRLGMFSAKMPHDDDGVRSIYDATIEEGKFILVSLSRESIAFSRMLCTIVKVLFQQTVLNRYDRYDRGELRNKERRLLFFVDEYSDVATDLQGSSLGDSNFISLARAYRCMVLLATQNVQMLKTSGLGSVQGAWEGVLGNMGAKMFLYTADPDTADYASKLLGESEMVSRVLNQTMGGDGVSHTVDVSVEEKKSLPPDVILQAFARGQGVVIGQLDGLSRPKAHFVAVPRWEDG